MNTDLIIGFAVIAGILLLIGWAARSAARREYGRGDGGSTYSGDSTESASCWSDGGGGDCAGGGGGGD